MRTRQAKKIYKRQMSTGGTVGMSVVKRAMKKRGTLVWSVKKAYREIESFRNMMNDMLAEKGGAT